MQNRGCSKIYLCLFYIRTAFCLFLTCARINVHLFIFYSTARAFRGSTRRKNNQDHHYHATTSNNNNNKFPFPSLFLHLASLISVFPWLAVRADIEVSDNLCDGNLEGIRLSMGSSDNKIFDNKVLNTRGSKLVFLCQIVPYMQLQQQQQYVWCIYVCIRYVSM